MGISWSTRRRQNHYYHHHQHPHYYIPNPPPPPPSQPQSHPFYYYPPSTTTSASSAIPESSPLPLPPPPPPPPPPPQPNNYVYVSPSPCPTPTTTHFQYQQHPPQIQSNYNYPGWSSSFNYPNPMVGPFFPTNYGNGWHQMRVQPPQQPLLPPPYVEHQSAKVVKNDVNVHKDTIKLEVDEDCPDQFLVSFVFDAHYDGSITIYYFAKEDKVTFSFTPVYPEASRSIKVPFQKGVGQRFRQPSGSGVDFNFFDLESLGKPSEDDVFPLVIYAEVYSSSHEVTNEAGESSADCSPRVQVTQAVIEKKNEGFFGVKALRQILYIDGVRYELRDLYGIGNTSSEGFSDDHGKECIICMTEPKNTAVMPCRHLCMCSDCAKELRLQTNKCPICRQPISELIEIKINNSGTE